MLLLISLGLNHARGRKTLRITVCSFMLLIYLAGCGGGGAAIPFNPPPQVPNVAGLWSATYHITSGATVVDTGTYPLVLLPSGADIYRFIDSDGVAYGNLTAGATTFSTTAVSTQPYGSGVYSYTMTLSGALTASSLNGGGQVVWALVSGIDAEGLDGVSGNVTFSATRQGPVPTGVSVNLTGTWLAQFDILGVPPGIDSDFSGNLTLTEREANIYNVSGLDDDSSTTIIAIGTTWYMLDEEPYEGSGTSYSQRLLASGTIATNSFTGGGTMDWTSEDGTDHEGYDGLQLQLTFQAARVN